MDLISLYYFSELAKDLHMTRTANRLFISQQTLSNHIKRLEESLNCELFERKPSLHLTCAGEAVLSFANHVNNEYTNLKDILSDITHQERGILRIGGSTLRLNACLPEILPEFSSRYPNVELRLTEANSSKLEPLILSGDLDFAIILSDCQHPNLICQHLIDDPSYLCAADSLLAKYYGTQYQHIKDAAIHGATISQFSELPFCLNSNRLGRHILECFEAAHIAPKTYMMSSETQISLTLCAQRTAACFSTQMRLLTQGKQLPPDINVFPLYSDGRPVTQTLNLIYQKDRYLSHYATLFLDLLKQYFSKLEKMHIEHKV